MEAAEGLTGEELKAVREIRRELGEVIEKYGKRIAKEFNGKLVGFVYGFGFVDDAKDMPMRIQLMRTGEQVVQSGIIHAMLTEMPDISREAVAAYNSTMERMNLNIASLADPTIS